MYMEILFIETPDFANKFDKLASVAEMRMLQNELIQNPEKGSLVKGTGGARKLRVKLPQTGKSGGARVIYYYIDLYGEIWFLDIYAKKHKESLTDTEKKKLYKFIKEKIHGSFK